MNKKIFSIFRSYDFHNNKILRAKCDTPTLDEHVANKKFVADEIAKKELNPPVYIIPTLDLNSDWEYFGEIGESLSDITASFFQNDAGPLISMKILKDGIPIVEQIFDTINYLTPILRTSKENNFQAIASYSAGDLKNYENSLIPDTRTPEILNVDAPQALNSNFISETIIKIKGDFYNFYGTPAIIPDKSSKIRFLNKTFTKTFNIFITAGETKCIIAYPATFPDITLLDVIHRLTPIGDYFTKITDWKTEGNAVDPQTNVGDASGVLHVYKVFKYEFLPFTNNEIFSVVIPS